MILAIVGSTLLEGDQEAARLIVMAFDRWQPDGFTSGGAKGIDSMAEEYARLNWRDIPEDRIFIFKPIVHRWEGPGGFRARNLLIAEKCDALVRIVSSKTMTYGSGWTRDRVKEMGKPWESFTVEQPT